MLNICILHVPTNFLDQARALDLLPAAQPGRGSRSSALSALSARLIHQFSDKMQWRACPWPAMVGYWYKELYYNVRRLP